MRHAFLLFVSVACLNCGGRLAAETFVERVFPPSVLRGETTRVVISGTELEGVLGLWASTPGVSSQLVEDQNDRCVFDVSVDGEVRLGLYGLRVATRDGLSNAHLFAIDDLRVTEEREAVKTGVDNGKRLSAQRVELPTSIAGSCGGADVDYYAIDVSAGQRVAFEVVGSRLGKPLDPVVTIQDGQGKFVLERDNDVGLFFDCRFEHTFKEAGRYFVRLQDSRYQGGEHWTYLLRMGRFPVARVAIPSTAPAGVRADISLPQANGQGKLAIDFPASLSGSRFFSGLRNADDDASAWLAFALSELPNHLEQEPNEALEQPNQIALPCNIHGRMQKPSDWDHYRFDLKRGQRIHVTSETRGMGSAADLELTLFGPDGKQLKQVDDSGFEDARFDFSAPSDGGYVLRVLDVVRKSGPAYVYRIEIRNRQPRLEVTSEIARIAAPRGSWQPLPLTVRRTDFNSAVELELQGAPEGVSLDASSIASGENALVARLKVAPSTEPGVYTLQVVAHSSAGERSLTAVAATHPLIDRLPTGRGPHGEPFELREDQRRLPPTLTDRIALVVLPESPFDFDVDAPLVVLPRYMSVDFLLKTARAADFDGEITFVARGGQLEKNRLQPPPVKWSIEPGLAANDTVRGKFRSGVNTATKRQRVTVTGTARQGRRTIRLTRTFDLEIKVAFQPAFDIETLELTPGGAKKVRLLANRIAPFDGDVQVNLDAKPGVVATATVVIPAAAKSVEIEIKSEPDAKAGKHTIGVKASSKIGKFNEEGGGKSLNIVIKNQADQPPDGKPAKTDGKPAKN